MYWGFRNKGAVFVIHSSFFKQVCKTHKRYTLFSNKGSNFEDPYHTLKTDPLFRVGEMKVTCRKCDRGARNLRVEHRTTSMGYLFLLRQDPFSASTFWGKNSKLIQKQIPKMSWRRCRVQDQNFPKYTKMIQS